MVPREILRLATVSSIVTPEIDRISPTWICARANQLEGTFPNGLDDGGWLITSYRVMRGWGSVTEAQYQWDESQAKSTPPPDPSLLDQAAKRNRIAFYSRVWDSGDCTQAAFVRNAPTCAAFYVTDKWRNPPEGRLDFNQVPVDISGGHSVHVSPPTI